MFVYKHETKFFICLQDILKVRKTEGKQRITNLHKWLAGQGLGKYQKDKIYKVLQRKIEESHD